MMQIGLTQTAVAILLMTFFKVANLPKIELTGTEGSQKVLNNEKENHSGNHGNLPSHLLAKIS